MSLSEISYFDLGVSMYSPAIHPNLLALMQGSLMGIRSMICCTEDAINEDQLEFALNNIKNVLPHLCKRKGFKCFIRPRNAAVLARLLNMEGIENIDGFVIPKADLNTLFQYKTLLDDVPHFAIMPTLETIQVFDVQALVRIRLLLDTFKNPIPCIRIGGNDLMNLLGIKHFHGCTIYETPLRSVIEQLLLTFRPFGYDLSAPVFNFIDDLTTLAREVQQDLAYGFYAKTAIHPNQVPIIEQAYQQCIIENIEQAKAILDVNSNAVFKMKGQMMEKACQKNWAERTLALAAAIN